MRINFLERTRQRRASSRSQAFVEFAFVLPIFLTLMCGVIDYGYMIGNAMVLAMAAREGANSGSRQLTDPMGKGLQAAVNVSKPRIILTNNTAGGIITQVMYDSAVSATKFRLADSSNPTNSCLSTGGIYGGGDALKNKSRILDGSVSNSVPWKTQTRNLPISPTVLDESNQVMTVMEVFCTNQFISPIGTLVGMVTPNVLYDVAYF